MTKLESDQSYGIIPLRKQDGQWNIFVIQQTAGHWSNFAHAIELVTFRDLQSIIGQLTQKL